MCDSADQPAVGRRPKRSNDVCHKCLAAKPTLKIRHTYYCQPCFLNAFVTKARVALGKVLRVPPPAKPRVLVAISGGHASRALLDLVHSFSKVDYLNTEKKKFDALVACHIDESLLFPTIQANAAIIKQWVVDCRMAYEGVSLEDAFKRETMEEGIHPAPWLRTSKASGPVESVYQAESTNAPARPPQVLLQQYLASATKLSTREDLLWHLKQALLHRVARKHRCEFIVVGDTCTRLAVKAIAMTSKGRGYSLPFDLGTGAEWFQDARFVRPFRDCMGREVVLYNRFKGLEAVHTPSVTTGLPIKSSIDRLTEDFIKGLDRDFPSTTSTVTRTAAKLKPSQEAMQQPACLLCQMPVQKGIPQWKAGITVRKLLKDSESSVEPNENTKALGTEHTLSADGTISLTPFLCYSCQTNVSEMQPGTYLPMGAAAQVARYREEQVPGQVSYATTGQETSKKPLSSDELRQRVAEFLLED